MQLASLDVFFLCSFCINTVWLVLERVVWVSLHWALSVDCRFVQNDLPQEHGHFSSNCRRKREKLLGHSNNACSCSLAKILLIISGSFQSDLLFHCFKNLWYALMAKSNGCCKWLHYVILCFSIPCSWRISCPVFSSHCWCVSSVYKRQIWTWTSVEKVRNYWKMFSGVLYRGFLVSLNFTSVLSLGRVMQTFVTQQWKCQSKDKLISPHSKKQTDKKVKSPLHIFSTLRR